MQCKETIYSAVGDSTLDMIDKNRCATSIWATLWMSSSDTSLTANVEILGFMGNLIVGGVCSCTSEALVNLNKGVPPLPTLTGEAGSELASPSSGMTLRYGPYSLTLPILNILSLRKQLKDFIPILTLKVKGKNDLFKHVKLELIRPLKHLSMNQRLKGDFRTIKNGRAGRLLARTGSLSGHPSKQQPRSTVPDSVT
ncbi:hypothetical protein J6590_075243 [Homalodisca vitripennis]|nr:hypothetical protein J6590_075243 [Homalodisca vitripennis]